MKPITYRLTRDISLPFIKLIFNPKVYGKENIPVDKGFVLAGNHTSKMDAFIIACAINKRDLFYIVKQELHEGFILKRWFFELGGTIPVDRKNKNNKNSLHRAEHLLKQNQIVTIFPEGTINKTDKDLMPFKYGAVSLAKNSNSYILPFAIKGKMRAFKSSVSIHIGKPYKTKSDLDTENEKLMNEVRKLLKETTNEETKRK